MENQHYLIFDTKYLHLVNFEEVLQTSVETVRKSLDGTKTFVKWESDFIPPSILSIPEPKQMVDYPTMCNILETEEWVKPFPINE